jgi:hypothetical protein
MERRSLTRRVALGGAGGLLVATPSLGRVSRLGGGMASPVLPGYFTTVNYGTVSKSNTRPGGYSTNYISSDVWANTWASDDKIYAVNDDSFGWQDAAPSSNLEVSLLSDYTTTFTGSSVNKMQAWGTASQSGSDGSNVAYKAMGLISVNGVLYGTAARQKYGTPGGTGIACKQSSANMQIIKATVAGATGAWTPQPPSTAQPYAAPMFAGNVNNTCWFVQYGKDSPYPGTVTPVDGNDQFVYAVSNDGFWNNGSKLFLGRVSIANLPNLNAADWSYYQGGDGSQPAAWTPSGSAGWASAQPLINPSPSGNSLQVSSNGVQYLPKFGCYIHIQWWYPAIVNNLVEDSSTTQWDIWQSTKLWGPWTLLAGASKVWNAPVGTGGRGLYNPNIMPKSLQVDGGATAMITCCGDYNDQAPHSTGSYTLTMVPVTIS